MAILSFSAKELVSHIKSGAISRRDVIRECRKRSKRVSSLNAFIRIVDEDVEFEESTSGSLSGVTVAVKDNFCTRDFATTCASRMLENFSPKYNATAVQKLEDSGAVIFGKTNLDEFAMGSGTTDSIFRPTKNIWGSSIEYKINGEPRRRPVNWRIAGGSSGGSAVAVASGACFGALGSDTGGSTRNPASYCGIVGFKPTYSTVSRHGLIPLVNSMDVPGILAKNVEDAMIIFNAICGQDPKDSTTVDFSPIRLDQCEVSSLKIGIPKEFHCPGMSKDVLDTWDRVAKLFNESGATIVPISMKHTSHSLVCYSIINQCEVASNMAKYDGLRYGHRASINESTEALYKMTRSQGLNSVVRARILAGNYFALQRNYEQFFEKALKVRRLICQDFERAWNQIDVLLTPTTLNEAPDFFEFVSLDNREQCTRSDYCTQPANMSGCPAISIPVQLSKNEMPLSVQLMAPNYREDSLLSVALWIEKMVDFPKIEISAI